MRRRRVVMFLLAGAVVVIAVLLIWPREREPEYKGRTLREWALVYGSDGYPFPVAKPQTPEVKDAVSAIRHIGTNGLPWMLEWIQYEPGPMRQKLSALADRLPPAFNFAFRDGAAGRALAAASCFNALGPQASPAIPELIRMLNDPTSSGRYGAAYALSQVGKDGLPPLAALLANPQAPAWNRATAAYYIGQMRDLGTNGTLAVEALVRQLYDPDTRVAADATIALGELALDADLAVPALAKALGDPRARFREGAAAAIGEFGDRGRPAVPALLQALDDPDILVRSAATNALRQIAPEVLP